MRPLTALALLLLASPVRGQAASEDLVTSTPNLLANNAFTDACCAAGWRGKKAISAVGPSGHTNTQDATLREDSTYGTVLHIQEHHTDEGVGVDFPIMIPSSTSSFALEYKMFPVKGNNYFHAGLQLTNAPTWRNGELHPDYANGKNLPHVVFMDDQWHTTNGRYCDWSRTAGLVLRLPGASADYDYVCNAANHVAPITFGVWWEVRMEFTWLDSGELHTLAKARIVGESEWHQQEATVVPDTGRTDIVSARVFESNWWTGHWIELTDVKTTVADAQPDPTQAFPNSAIHSWECDGRVCVGVDVESMATGQTASFALLPFGATTPQAPCDSSTDSAAPVWTVSNGEHLSVGQFEIAAPELMDVCAFEVSAHHSGQASLQGWIVVRLHSEAGETVYQAAHEFVVLFDQTTSAATNVATNFTEATPAGDPATVAVPSTLVATETDQFQVVIGTDRKYSGGDPVFLRHSADQPGFLLEPLRATIVVNCTGTQFFTALSDPAFVSLEGGAAGITLELPQIPDSCGDTASVRVVSAASALEAAQKSSDADLPHTASSEVRIGVGRGSDEDPASATVAIACAIGAVVASAVAGVLVFVGRRKRQPVARATRCRVVV